MSLEDPTYGRYAGEKGEFNPGDIKDVRQRTRFLIDQAVRNGRNLLLQSPPNAGKTTSVFKTAAQTGKQITYLAMRIDLYEQAIDLCEGQGIDHATVPSPYRDCPAFDEDSPTYDPMSVQLYELGISAADIHTSSELPCSKGCAYMQAWNDFEPDATDVIIGHHTHAFIQDIIEDRIVIVDEFPGDAFQQDFTNHEQAITNFLQNADGLPFSDFFDPIEHRENHFDQAFSWFLDNGVTADPDTILDLKEGERYHTLTPFLVYSMLMTVDHGNGFESPTLNLLEPDQDNYPDDELNRHVAIDRERAELFVLTQPDLTDARAVIGLDGTPTPKLWELSTGVDLDHQRVLTDPAARNKYLREGFGIVIKQANDSLKPYHNGDITPERDVGLLYEVEVAEGESPTVITTKNAREQYEHSEAMDHVDSITNYGKVLSSNEFNHKSVGVVQGCPHPGDQVIKRWGAYLGEGIDAEGEGINRAYCESGDPVYKHFVHNQVLQAILRFGRDNSVDETTVYVNTAALPDWVEVDNRVKQTLFNTGNKRAVADFLQIRGSGGATKQEIADGVDVSVRTVERHLVDLQRTNRVEIVDNPGPRKNSFVWSC